MKRHRNRTPIRQAKSTTTEEDESLNAWLMKVVCKLTKTSDFFLPYTGEGKNGGFLPKQKIALG